MTSKPHKVFSNTYTKRGKYQKQSSKLMLILALLLSLPMVSAADSTIYVVSCGLYPCPESYTQQQAQTWYHTLQYMESFQKTYAAVEDYRDLGRCWVSSYRRNPATGEWVRECGE